MIDRHTSPSSDTEAMSEIHGMTSKERREQMRATRQQRSTPRRTHKLLASLIAAVCTLVAMAVVPAAASAAPAPRLESLANSTAAAGSTVSTTLVLDNLGDAPFACPGPGCTLTVDVPAGATVSSLAPDGAFTSCTNVGTPGPTTVACNRPTVQNTNPRSQRTLTFNAGIDPGVAEGTRLTLKFALYGPSVSGAVRPDGTPCLDDAPPGDPCVGSSQTITVTSDESEFGLESIDLLTTEIGGSEFNSQAGAVAPELVSAFDLSTERKAELSPFPISALIDNYSVEPVKDVVFDLPPGMVGNPTVADRCTLADLSAPGSGIFNAPVCSPDSQVGMVTVRVNTAWFPLPVFNLETGPYSPGRFGFAVLGSVVVLDTEVRSGGDYGLSVGSRNTTQGLPLVGTTLNMWGVPADPVHDGERQCPGALFAAFPLLSVSSPGCLDENNDPYVYERPEEAAFLRNPTSCSGALDITAHATGWENPGVTEKDGSPDLSDANWKSKTIQTHKPLGFPLAEEDWGAPQGYTGCNTIPFNPSISVETTSDEADSPTGFDVEISVPQTSDPEVLSSSDLKDAVVTLPEGFTLNPSSAGGLDGCTLEQIDLEGRNTEPKCPKASKVGTTEIDTPLLADPLEGSVYVAESDDPDKPGAENPFDSLVAIYIVAEGQGTVIKLKGKVDLDPDTGQVQATFADNPQLPFNTLKTSFFDGPRSPIATPTTCGAGEIEAELTPWARPGSPITKTDGIEITEGANGNDCPASLADRPFNPEMKAGVKDPVAGGYSPFVFQLTREDGEQEILSTTVKPPQGLTAKLAGIPYCSEADIAAVSCPAESKIGSELAGAGAGSSPFYTSANPGSVYLAGPYKGAPLSMVIEEPVIAGPFDLDDISVRAAIHVDPRTAELTVISDEIPQINSGIPLRIRDLRIRMDRPEFTIAPTNCDPMQIDASVMGSHGATANLTNRFQVGSCGNLGFSPNLELDFGKRKKSTKPGANPPLNANLSFNEGDSNISSAVVTLPQGVLLDDEQLGFLCSQSRYEQGTCPESSRVGYAKANTPLLDEQVEGPVYLKASTNPLPDLAADLNGQIDIDLIGRIDQKQNKKGINQIRNTFDVVPDVPVSSFELKLSGGNAGLLENSSNLCSSKKGQRVSIDMQAHNEMTLSERPLIGSACDSLNKKKAKKLKKKAKKLQRKAKRTDNPRKAKQLRKKAKKLKRQARKLGR